MLRILAMMFIMLLTACASDPLTLSQDAKENFQKAELYMENENYTRATLFLQKFSAKFPYSQYATTAEFMRLKAAYLDGQYILSETLGLRFVEAHPEHEQRIQAEFYIAMSYYKQSSSAHLDQKFSHKSRDAFVSLNQRFPDNTYTKQTQKFLTILTNRIAENEMIVGKFYFDRDLYVAAINRFLLIKNDYINAEAAAESLYYLAASYAALEQKVYANEVIDLIKQNFPQNDWYKKAKNLI